MASCASVHAWTNLRVGFRPDSLDALSRKKEEEQGEEKEEQEEKEEGQEEEEEEVGR